MTKKSVSVEQIAAEFSMARGKALYLLHQRNAPLPVMRGRELRWDRDEIVLYLRRGSVQRC